MTKNIILLVDADADLANAALEVASQTGHGVRLAKTSRDAFKVLKDEIDSIDVAIIDIDPGAHGMALLEAISGREERPPVIVLTALEETYMAPIAERHGAAACMGKPVSVEKLKSTIDQVPRRRGLVSDAWGHLRGQGTPTKKEESVRKVHGICKELVPLSSRRLD
jgi:DNA-binding NtrC family response regulator